MEGGEVVAAGVCSVFLPLNQLEILVVMPSITLDKPSHNLVKNSLNLAPRLFSPDASGVGGGVLGGLDAAGGLAGGVSVVDGGVAGGLAGAFSAGALGGVELLSGDLSGLDGAADGVCAGVAGGADGAAEGEADGAAGAVCAGVVSTSARAADLSAAVLARSRACLASASRFSAS